MINAAHALAAAACPRLDQHGITNTVRLAFEENSILIIAVIARHDRYTGLFHQRLGSILQPHGTDGLCRWADEGQPRRLDSVDKPGILREKAITRMDCLCAGFQCGFDDRLDIEIALRRKRRADANGLVGHFHMQRIGIRIRIDRHSGDTEFTRSADDPASYFPAIGNQYLLKHHSCPRGMRAENRFTLFLIPRSPSTF